MEETSYGIIPLKRMENEWYTLLVMHTKGGFWAFPKGHAEPNETPQVAASRELLEETGLKVKTFLSSDTLNERYHFHRDKKLIHKTVVYFLAEVEGEILLQPSEIEAIQWVKLSEAEHQITYQESRSVCRQALQRLKTVR